MLTSGDMEQVLFVGPTEPATKQTGYTIVPLLVFLDEHGRAKMDIALCKGKKSFDKRQTLKEKEDRREMDRAFKRY